MPDRIATPSPPPPPWDVIVVGAGAAGLATAIFTRTLNPASRVLLLDGARKPGAKILVSGGGRCNVTNTVVTERDYWGGSPALVRRVLRAFSVRETIDFFSRIGVPLHEEADGKLVPDSSRARDVLDALLRCVAERGVTMRAAERVSDLVWRDGLFEITSTLETFSARAVVLATGGQSLPKTGSDGAGYGLAARLGHTIVPTTPALAPLILDATGSIHGELAGVSVDSGLTLWVDGGVSIRLRGALLWTHFGISGPVVLDVSRHWLRARLEGRQPVLTASFVPDRDFAAMESHWLDESRSHPRALVAASLARLVPASMATALARRLDIDPATPLAHLERPSRRRLSHALTEWPLPVQDSRGYSYAEATAGGIHLREVDATTMESRVRPGLYLVGEMLDIDGRLGGFNFQWAWSSARVAAAALARR